MSNESSISEKRIDESEFLEKIEIIYDSRKEVNL
jgi:hypothetical protein